MKSCFLLFLLASIFIVKTIGAQEVEWIIEPVIDNVLEVKWTVESKQFIVVKTKKGQGVINNDNKTIIPPTYKWINITGKNKLIMCAKFEGGYDYFLANGQQIADEEYEGLLKKYSPWKKKEYPSQAVADILGELKDLKSKIKIIIGEDNISRLNGYYDIYTPKKELLAKGTVLGKSNITNKKFLSIYDKVTKLYMITNIFTGEVIYSGPKYSLTQNDSRYFVVHTRGVAKVFSPEGELLAENEKFSLINDKNLGIGKKNGVSRLFDLSSMSPIGEKASKIYCSDKNAEYILFKKDDSTSIYNTRNKKMISLPYRYHHNPPVADLQLAILSTNNLKGVWSPKNEEWIIQPEYGDVLYSKHGYFIVAKDKYTKRFHHNVLYDIEGKLIYDHANLGISCFESIFSVIELDSTTTIKSYDNENLASYQKETVIRANAKGNIVSFVDNANKSNTESFHISQFSKKEKSTFNKIEKTLKLESDSRQRWYIVTKDMKYGIINDLGDILLPVHYSKIIVEKKKQYITVEPVDKVL